MLVGFNTVQISNKIKNLEMNISSIVVCVNLKHEEQIISQLNKIEFCEYHLSSGDGRLIVTLEGESVNDEIQSLTKIKQIPGVISAEMVYSYAADELNREREKLGLADGQPPDWLNDDNVDVSKIKYHGDLRGRF